MFSFVDISNAQKQMSGIRTSFLLLSLVLITSGSFAQSKNGTIRGQITDHINGLPLAGVTVSIPDENLNKITDDNGEFRFDAVPVGRLELIITSVGYKKVILKELVLESSTELLVNQSLESSQNILEQVVVRAATPNMSGAMTSIQSITTEQIFRYPATFFDPARLAFSFPGVANTNDQANGMSIRGNNPATLQWRLEGMEIVNPNHLSNAGTFSDQPSANAGGTNMLSAQMLGNMNFLTGAFPAEYGNAIGGIMDMRLRKGNNQKYEHKAQIGLIGVDLASEGPINKSKGSSYLVNYRYSFTGLLALGGITFGGEAITFQDISFNLSFPNKKLGDFNLFGIGGKNSNEFAFSPEDGQSPETIKDLYNIDYFGKMGAAGVTHKKNFNENLSWKNTLIWSGLKNDRTQSANSYSNLPLVAFQNRNLSSRLSFSSILNSKLAENASLKAGVYITQSTDSLYASIEQVSTSFKSVILQPFVQFESKLGERSEFVLGLHNLNYTYNNTHTLEPRISYAYKITIKDAVHLAYGLHSQLQSPWAYSLKSAGNNNLDLKPSLSQQVVFNFQHDFNASYIRTEFYYQSLENQLQVADKLSTFNYYSGVNVSDYTLRNKLNNAGKGRNYGVELAFQKYLDNGIFVLTNLTLYKSEFSNQNGSYSDGKYSGNHILNLTLGKEWEVSKSRIIGANLRVIWMGGFRDYQIDLAKSQLANTTIFDYSNPLSVKYPDYFRPDIRVYFKKSKTKFNRMWSLDIQNVAGYQNVAFDYYDAFQSKIVRKNQLGMIPMLNYRWEF